jgi:glycosyltransferase involved in cell wall biosynthesis
MNIIYDPSIFSQRYGGVSRYFYEIITRLLHRQELNIFLFQGFYANEYPLNKHKKEYKFYFGVKRPAIPYTNCLFSVLNHYLFRAYFRLNQPAKPLYHPTYYSKTLGKVKASTKVVVTVYDMVCELYPEQFSNAEAEIESKKISIERADHIICISENTKKDLINFYNIHQDKIDVIYLASSLETKNTEMEESKVTLSKPYILYMGSRRTAYKNFYVVLDAFDKGGFSRDFDLLCFGSGGLSNSELKTFASRGLINSVQYARGNDSFLADIYKKAACLVYPSFYEGFGFPTLEAMSLDCPVIAANSGSIPEVAGDAAILFDPQSVDCLIESLKRLLYSCDLTETLRQAGRSRSGKFSWEITAEKTLGVYKGLG